MGKTKVMPANDIMVNYHIFIETLKNYSMAKDG